jgi:hypothetical protein
MIALSVSKEWLLYQTTNSLYRKSDSYEENHNKPKGEKIENTKYGHNPTGERICLLEIEK